VLLLASVLTAAFAARPKSRLRVPGALLFLGIGMLGRQRRSGSRRLDDPELVRDIGVVALLVILFEGGLTTKPTDLRLAAIPGVALSTVGVASPQRSPGFGAWLLLDIDR
jgi:potassium/hydrogen antiporter